MSSQSLEDVPHVTEGRKNVSPPLLEDRSLFPEPHSRELDSRLCNRERLLDVMGQRGLDGLVASLRPHVFYLSGFAPPSSMSLQETNGYAVVIISRHAPGDSICVTADFDVPYFSSRPSWIRNIRPYKTLIVPLDIEVPEPAVDIFLTEEVRRSEWGSAARGAYAGSMDEAVHGALTELGLDRGVVGFDDLRQAARFASPRMEVRDAYGAVKYVRQVKTEAEVQILREATQINQFAIENTIATWAPGMTWQQMIRSYHLRSAELGGYVHDPGGIVVANHSGADPAYFMHAGPEDFVVEAGMHIMWDCHGTWGSYCWDGGKTWIVDAEIEGDAKVIATATADAMQVIQDNMRPGVKISELQARGRSVLRQSGAPGADQALIFFHGLGLEHIDMELTGSRVDWALEDGMVVSAHLQLPGDDRSRNWLEEISLVTAHGGDRFFSWDHMPLEGQ